MAQSDVGPAADVGRRGEIGGDPPGQQQEFNPFSEAGHVRS